MGFPLSKLRPVGGTLYGHVFENRKARLRRGLYWSVGFEFAPVRYRGESWQTSVMAEWLVWPVGRLQDLHGAGLDSLSKPALAEVSFYLGEHHAGRLDELQLTRAGRREFQVRLALTFDLIDPGGDEVPGAHLDVTGRVRFAGIYVIPANLAPQPRTAAAAARVAGRFIDLAELRAPAWDEFKYVFSPR